MWVSRSTVQKGTMGFTFLVFLNFLLFHLSIPQLPFYDSWTLLPIQNYDLTHTVWLLVLTTEALKSWLGPALHLLPPPPTLSFVLDYTCLVGCCSAMLEWGPVGLGFLTLAGWAGCSSGERSSGWNTWQKQRRPSSLIEWLGSWVASWLIRVLASQVVGLDPMAVL